MPHSPSYPPTSDPSYAYNAAPADASVKLEVSSTADSNTITESKPKEKVDWRDRGWDTALGRIDARRFMKKSYIKWYILLLIIGVLAGLMALYKDEIIQWMEPIAQDIKDLPASWTIPVGILFVLSFPPLFGHEIIAILCGIIWPLWIAFGIVALGTLLGEWGNFVVFRYMCTKRAQKWEKEDTTYACMTRVIQEGGFWVIFVARLSAIPGHLTTAVFSTCGVGFWTFTMTAILTTPKQLQIVYLGTIFNQSDEEEGTTEKIVSYGVLIFSFIVTIVAAWWLYRKMARVRPIIEKERQEMLDAREARNSVLSVPAGQPGMGQSSERLTDDPEAPAGYDDPYSKSRHIYSQPQYTSSSLGLSNEVNPTAGLSTTPYDDPYRLMPAAASGRSRNQQQRHQMEESSEDLGEYTRRQAQAYSTIISAPPQSRPPSFHPEHFEHLHQPMSQHQQQQQQQYTDPIPRHSPNMQPQPEADRSSGGQQLQYARPRSSADYYYSHAM